MATNKGTLALPFNSCYPRLISNAETVKTKIYDVYFELQCFISM